MHKAVKWRSLCVSGLNRKYLYGVPVSGSFQNQVCHIYYGDAKTLLLLLFSCFSSVCLCETLWTVARQAPLSVEFSRQEYWSGWPFPSPGDLPDTGIEAGSPALQAESLPSESPEKPPNTLIFFVIEVQLLISVVLVSTCSEMNQLYIYIYTLLFEFPFHLGHHRALNRVPCAIYNRFSLVILYQALLRH